MLRLAVLMLVGFMLLTLSSAAQSPVRNRIQQRLNEASNYFSQNDFLMGANRVNEACSMLRSSPAAMPESNYIEIASKAADDLDAKLRAARARNDKDSVTKIASGLEPLVNSLSSWDAQNPRWHYLHGVVYQTLYFTKQNGFINDLQSAIREFDASLAIQGGGSFRAGAMEGKSTCQKELQKIQSAIAAPVRRPAAHGAGASSRSSGGGPWYCYSCGREKSGQNFRCPYCGAL